MPDPIDIMMYVIIIFVCLLFVSSIQTINEYRHITIRDKCCTLRGECFVFDTLNQKYSTGIFPYDVYSGLTANNSYHVHVVQGVFGYMFNRDTLYITSVWTEDEWSQTCEAKGLVC